MTIACQLANPVSALIRIGQLKIRATRTMRDREALALDTEIPGAGSLISRLQAIPTGSLAIATGAWLKLVRPPERQHWGGVLPHLHDPDGNVLTLVGE